MASKRRLRRKACEGKKRYATQLEAVVAIKAMARRKALRGGSVEPYRCLWCGGFHFGHVSQANRMERLCGIV